MLNTFTAISCIPVLLKIVVHKATLLTAAFVWCCSQ